MKTIQIACIHHGVVATFNVTEENLAMARQHARRFARDYAAAAPEPTIVEVRLVQTLTSMSNLEMWTTEMAKEEKA